ncbi:MAG TPA: DUF455 family protein [Thermoanaerobaculia bacterium]
MSDFGFFDIGGGIKMREEPARDACFKVVRTEAEMEQHSGFDEVSRREMVHRHMSNEITSLDIAAQCLVDFQDTPWALRMELARQCWDEARHVRVLHRRLLEMGGRKGEFPISTFEWSVTCAIDNLAGRLATQNRTFEAGAMDVVAGLIASVREAGDAKTADVLDGILADEVQHVRFANRWIKKMVADDRRVLFRVAQAIRFLADANARLFAMNNDPSAAPASPEQNIPAVNIADRRLAEFSEDEVQEILRQAGFRSIIPDAREHTV